MIRNKLLLLGLGVIFIIISVWQIFAAQKGLDVIYLRNINPNLTIIRPSTADAASRPTVLIAHGFAGSSVLMRGFALTLAHAGFNTVSWDFQGHGENPNPLISSPDNLLKDAEAALAAAESSGWTNNQQIAILGHSMGSGVALSYGMSHPETAATIAISPVNQPINTNLPHNLLLMAGSLELRFVNNAEQLLNLAGGQNSDFNKGSARKFTVIPGVEHITILFSPQAHATAHSWLEATFGIQPAAGEYTDRRILWFGLGILGFLLVSNACMGLIKSSNPKNLSIRPLRIRMIAIFVGGLTATIILWLVSLSKVDINQLLGLLVGGYLIIWFGVAGIASLIILRPTFSRPTFREVACGLISFAALWLGVGVLGNFVWLPWMLIPNRSLLWIPGSLLLLPWFYSIGYVTKDSGSMKLIGWWLFEILSILVSLFLAITINPELGFLFIILPLVPIMIGLHWLAIASKHGIWAFASSGAMFTAWLILAVFPIL